MKKILFLLISTWVFSNLACKKKISKEQSYLLDLLIRPHLDSNLTAKYYDLDITLGLWVYNQQYVYFYLSPDENLSTVKSKILIDTTDFEQSPCDGSPCKWGDLKIRETDKILFRTHDYNLRVPHDNLGLRFTYRKSKPMWTLEEIQNQNEDSYYYNFLPYVYDNKSQLYFFNHAKYISPKNNAFLQKFLDERINQKNSKDNQVDQIFRFVTDSIEYIYIDYWYQKDLGIMPYETLLSCRGDCSAKSVLFASLLEQIGAEYCLFFYDGHMNVGVKKANPTSKDIFYIRVENEKYYIAETTEPQFIIGQGFDFVDFSFNNSVVKDVIDTSLGESKIIYYQIPSQHSSPLKYKTDEPLIMLTEGDVKSH